MGLSDIAVARNAWSVVLTAWPILRTWQNDLHTANPRRRLLLSPAERTVCEVMEDQAPFSCEISTTCRKMVSR